MNHPPAYRELDTRDAVEFLDEDGRTFVQISIVDGNLIVYSDYALFVLPRASNSFHIKAGRAYEV